MCKFNGLCKSLTSNPSLWLLTSDYTLQNRITKEEINFRNDQMVVYKGVPFGWFDSVQVYDMIMQHKDKFERVLMKMGF